MDTTSGGSPVETTIAAWSSRRISGESAAFARAVVGAASPHSCERAKALLFATSRLAAFGERVGLELRPEVLLHSSVIERFIVADATCMSVPTRRTVRTNLRHVAARVAPARGPASVALPRERAKAPYTEAEIAGFLALADTQPTEYRRMRAVGLIALGAGAGLMGADLRTVRGTDIAARPGGMIVTVSGRRARTVPVRPVFHQRLVTVAGFFGDTLVVGGVDLARRNVTTPLIASLSGGGGLPRLEIARLRSTWLGACAQTIGLKAFMCAAGLVCTQRLGDLVSHLPDVEEAEAITLLCR
jgi:integrase